MFLKTTLACKKNLFWLWEKSGSSKKKWVNTCGRIQNESRTKNNTWVQCYYFVDFAAHFFAGFEVPKFGEIFLIFFFFSFQNGSPITLVVMNPKAENSCFVRRAKLSKQTAPRKSGKQILEDKQYYRRWVSIWHRFPQRATNFTDVGRRFEFERGKIKYTKAVNVFGLVTKSWQSKLTMKRYEKHSKRQCAKANHPK